MPQTRLRPLEVRGDGGEKITDRRLGKPVTRVANRGLGGGEVGVVRIDDTLRPCSAARLLFLSGSPLRRLCFRPRHRGPLLRRLRLCLRLLRLAQFTLEITRPARIWLAVDGDVPSTSKRSSEVRHTLLPCRSSRARAAQRTSTFVASGESEVRP